MDLELTRCLRAQGLTTRGVIEDGRWLTLKTVVNQNTAAENATVRRLVHPGIVSRGAEIARLLRIRLAGIDLITPDISRPLDETGGLINEVNTTPALHHHYLIDNPEHTVPVAERLLDRLLDSEGPWR
jgi:cyanophycin synthetase